MVKDNVAMRFVSIFLAAILAISVSGCGNSGQKQEDGSDNNPTTTYEIKTVGTYKAAEAVLNGNVNADSDGIVSGFEEDGDTCTFNVDIEDEGFYDLDFVASTGSGSRQNYVSVDGERMGIITTGDSEFTDCTLNHVYLSTGAHSIELSTYWGWINLERLDIITSEPIDQDIYNVSATLVNENATDNARRLMSYLTDIYGSQILSGQYCSLGQYGKENAIIYQSTGKYPAILGLDMVMYTPSCVANGGESKATDYAINFWNNGGIVTFCWHWNAPEKYLTKEWYRGFYADSTDIDIAKIMDGEDEEGYELLMEDIDAIAAQLLILQENGVPVLWRPLHEASGGWFWWGAGGAEAYKKLYILLYDRLTNEYGLNNLIWLWNGQDKEWYPGDEYVDIIGEDLYPGEHVYTSQAYKYLEAVDYTENTKMVVMSENGCVFDPELAQRDGAMWGFFCTWSDEFIAKNTAIYDLNEQYTEEYMLNKAYNSELVITLDELPDLKTYPIHD